MPAHAPPCTALGRSGNAVGGETRHEGSNPSRSAFSSLARQSPRVPYATPSATPYSRHCRETRRARRITLPGPRFSRCIASLPQWCYCSSSQRSASACLLGTPKSPQGRLIQRSARIHDVPASSLAPRGRQVDRVDNVVRARGLGEHHLRREPDPMIGGQKGQHIAVAEQHPRRECRGCGDSAGPRQRSRFGPLVGGASGPGQKVLVHC
jgi:hypothetical protein